MYKIERVLQLTHMYFLVGGSILVVGSSWISKTGVVTSLVTLLRISVDRFVNRARFRCFMILDCS